MIDLFFIFKQKEYFLIKFMAKTKISTNKLYNRQAYIIYNLYLLSSNKLLKWTVKYIKNPLMPTIRKSIIISLK
jgi:hypothetical protein